MMHKACARCRLLVPLLLALMLCGCREVGIGEQNILRAIYLEREGADYSARLICIHSAPAADTSQIQETGLILRGTGHTLFEALQEAGSAGGEELFYGQNELLLLGPSLSMDDPLEAVEFLLQQQSGRPGTGVYLVDRSPEELDRCQDLSALISRVELVRRQGGYWASAHRLDRHGSSILPWLHLDLERPGAEPDGAAVFWQGKAILQWNNNQTQLARLLAGQARKADFLLQGRVPLHFWVDSADTAYNVVETPAGPVLHVEFQGHVRQIQSAQGWRRAGDEPELLLQINDWLAACAQEMFNESSAAGADVFSYTQRLMQYHAGTALELARQGRLCVPQRVQFCSQLKGL